MSSHTFNQLQSRKRTDPSATLNLLGQVLCLEPPVIKGLQRNTLRADDPKFIQYMATVADVGRFAGANGNLPAGGIGTQGHLALVKAVGEGVERYCAEDYDPSRVSMHTYDEVKGEAIDPQRFVMFHAEQYAQPNFPFSKITSSTSIGWTSAYSLTHQKDVLIPALMAFLAYGTTTAEPPWETINISGYACGNSPEEAILGALCELIERDAFMLFWYHWMWVPGIELESGLSDEGKEILSRFQDLPLRIQCSSLTNDLGVPVVLAAAMGTGPGQPAAVISLAADPNPQRATAKALMELASNHIALRYLAEDRLRRGQPVPPVAINTQEDHGLLYTDPRMLTLLAPILQPVNKVNLNAWPAETSADCRVCIGNIVERLAKLGLEVIVLDIAPPRVKELGLHAVKVIIPGIQPIDFASVKHFGGQRLFEVPKRLGYAVPSPLITSLNQSPHPFL